MFFRTKKFRILQPIPLNVRSNRRDQPSRHPTATPTRSHVCTYHMQPNEQPDRQTDIQTDIQIGREGENDKKGWNTVVFPTRSRRVQTGTHRTVCMPIDDAMWHGIETHCAASRLHRETMGDRLLINRTDYVIQGHTTVRPF